MPFCEAVGPKGPCRCRPLKGQRLCFIHSPTTAAARSAARARGGDRRHARPAASTKRTSESAAPLSDLADLRFETRADIRDALVKVAKGLATGTLPTARAKVLLEVLRNADRAFEDAPVDPKAPPPGCRLLTDAEMKYLIDNGGRFPPGVQPYERIRDRPWWVEGPVWTPPPAEGEPGSN